MVPFLTARRLTAADSHDIAVIKVPAAEVAARWTFTPATLPTAGQLDQLGPRGLDATPFVVAGYGTQEAQRGPGGHAHPGGDVRMKAPVTFNALNKRGCGSRWLPCGVRRAAVTFEGQ